MGNYHYKHSYKGIRQGVPRVAAIVLTLILAACGGINNDKPIMKTVDSFADAYYNWQFNKAMTYCTPESKKWLQFAATNVHQADIDILRSQDEGASHNIDSVKHLNDTSAVAFISVSNYVRMDTIGKAGQVIKQANFNISVKRRNGKWLVDLRNLPKSEK